MGYSPRGCKESDVTEHVAHDHPGPTAVEDQCYKSTQEKGRLRTGRQASHWEPRLLIVTLLCLECGLDLPIGFKRRRQTGGDGMSSLGFH